MAEEKENRILNGRTIKLIPISMISIRPGFNPRFIFDRDKLSELKDDIEKNGVLEPLQVKLVAENGFDIVDGERRFKCAGELGMERVPCIVLPAAMGDEELYKRSFSHGKGVPLTPLEMGGLFYKFRNDFSRPLQDIADLFSVSISTVNNYLTVYQSASSDLIEDIKSGRVKMSEAVRQVRTGERAVFTEEKKEKKEKEKEIKSRVPYVLKYIWNKVEGYIETEEREKFLEIVEYLLHKFEKFSKMNEDDETETEEEEVVEKEKKRGRGRPSKKEEEKETETEEEEVSEFDEDNDDENELEIEEEEEEETETEEEKVSVLDIEEDDIDLDNLDNLDDLVDEDLSDIEL